LAIDTAGDIYVTGGLGGSIDFGTGPLTTAGSSDVYVVKLDPSTGNAVWAFNAGDDVDQNGVNIAVNAAGQLAVTGTYTGTLAFPGINSLVSPTDSVFVAGFDQATGAALWVHDVALGGGAILGITADPTDGGIVVTGFTGAGAAANFGSGALVNLGGRDVVVAKYNAKTGALLWAKQLGSTLDQLSNAVAVDSTGAIYITGQYSGAPNFGSGALPAATSAQKRIFLAKLTNVGGGVAARSFGVAGQQRSVAVSVDSTGVYIGGSMVGTVDFGGGALVSAGGQDAFAAKYSLDLATTTWAVRFGDPGSQNAQGLSLNKDGNVVIAGLFEGVVDTGAAGVLTSAGGFDAFSITLDGKTGASKCALGAGDDAAQSASRVASDPLNGGDYVLGTFLQTINWGGGALTGSASSSQTFLVKLAN
jgi:hypothetical protein